MKFPAGPYLNLSFIILAMKMERVDFDTKNGLRAELHGVSPEEFARVERTMDLATHYGGRRFVTKDRIDGETVTYDGFGFDFVRLSETDASITYDSDARTAVVRVRSLPKYRDSRYGFQNPFLTVLNDLPISSHIGCVNDIRKHLETEDAEFECLTAPSTLDWLLSKADEIVNGPEYFNTPRPNQMTLGDWIALPFVLAEIAIKSPLLLRNRYLEEWTKKKEKVIEPAFSPV